MIQTLLKLVLVLGAALAVPACTDDGYNDGNTPRNNRMDHDRNNNSSPGTPQSPSGPGAPR